MKLLKILGGKIMNKTELVAAVAQKAELSKKDAEKAVAAVTAAITDALCAGDKVQLVGFGTFEVRNSISTYAPIPIPHITARYTNPSPNIAEI